MSDLVAPFIAALGGAMLVYWAWWTAKIIREVLRDTETESVFDSIAVVWRVLGFAILVAFICMLVSAEPELGDWAGRLGDRNA